jgi:hypothetical protein
MRRGARGLRASVGFAKELAQCARKRLGRVLCYEVAARAFGNRGRGGLVFDQLPCRGGQHMGIVVGHGDAGVLNRKRRRGPLHRDDGERPGKRIEHLDREPAFGPPRNPAQIACSVCELAGSLAVETAEVKRIGNPQAVCQAASRGRVGLRRKQQRCGWMGVSQNHQGLDQGLPPLVAIEVARVEANVGIRGKAQRGAGFIPRRWRRVR